MSIARDIGHVGTRDRDEPLPDPEMNEELQWKASEEDPVRRAGTLSIPLSILKVSSNIKQEALIRAPETSVRLQVIYNILLSPTYHVPVLYFQLRQDNHPGPLGIDAVYQYLVPEQYRKELQSIGIMGGISFGVCASSRIPSPSWSLCFVVSSRLRNSSIFRSSMPNNGCDEAHCRTALSHSRDLSHNLARVGG